MILGIYTALDQKFKKEKINRLDAHLRKKTGRLSPLFDLHSDLHRNVFHLTCIATFFKGI